MSVSKQFAEFIKQKRHAMGLSLREFSMLIFNDVHHAGYLCKIENNKIEITISTLNLILSKINCSVSFNEF